MALPHAPDHGGGNPDSPQAQLSADANVAVGRIPGRHLEDLLLQLWRRLVRHPRLPPLFRRQALRPVLLVGVPDLVEVAAADAGPFTGKSDVLQFLGQGQQPQPGLDKLLSGAHGQSPFGAVFESQNPKHYHRRRLPWVPSPLGLRTSRTRPGVRRSPAKFVSRKGR